MKDFTLKDWSSLRLIRIFIRICSGFATSSRMSRLCVSSRLAQRGSLYIVRASPYKIRMNAGAASQHGIMWVGA
eukprot:8210370-Karenia_brevis.AAC.1